MKALPLGFIALFLSAFSLTTKTFALPLENKSEVKAIVEENDDDDESEVDEEGDRDLERQKRREHRSKSDQARREKFEYQREENPRPKNGSAQNREKNRWGVGAGLGVFSYPGIGGGLHVHYNKTSNIQFEFSAWNGNWKENNTALFSRALYEDIDASMNLSHFRVKIFPGNSFFIATGLGFRQIDFKLEANNGSSRFKKSITRYNGIFSFAIGNIWTLDSGLYIGGEWLTLMHPIFSSTSSDKDVSGGAVGDFDSQESRVDRYADDISKDTSTGVAQFQIGFSF